MATTTLPPKSRARKSSPAAIATQTPDPIDVIDRLRRANAVLATFIETIPDARAEDRYVLWTVSDFVEEVIDAIDGLRPLRRRL